MSVKIYGKQTLIVMKSYRGILRVNPYLKELRHPSFEPEVDSSISPDDASPFPLKMKTKQMGINNEL